MKIDRLGDFLRLFSCRFSYLRWTFFEKKSAPKQKEKEKKYKTGRNEKKKNINK